MLTGIPVLVFGLGAPFALLLVNRVGPDVSSLMCLGAVCAGVALRSTGPYALALLGTLVVGLGIAVGNIAVPVAIRRDVPRERLAATNALYSATLNIGAVALLLFTRPLSDAMGWQLALAVPAGTAALAAAGVLWIRRPMTRGSGGVSPVREDEPARRSMLRDPVILLLTAAFAGQCTIYYCLTAWLPTILRESTAAGSAADATAAVFQLSAIFSAVALPTLLRRLEQRSVIIAAGGLWVACATQLLLVPKLALLGSVLGGMGQGAGLAMMLTLAAQRARSESESARALTVIQGAGYALAAASPSLIGAMRDATHGWTAPLMMLLGVAFVLPVAGSLAAVKVARAEQS